MPLRIRDTTRTGNESSEVARTVSRQSTGDGIVMSNKYHKEEHLELLEDLEDVFGEEFVNVHKMEITVYY